MLFSRYSAVLPSRSRRLVAAVGVASGLALQPSGASVKWSFCDALLRGQAVASLLAAKHPATPSSAVGGSLFRSSPVLLQSASTTGTGASAAANDTSAASDAGEGTPDFNSSNLYKRLGLSKATATEDSIKKAFRKLALKYHPDVSATAEESTTPGEPKLTPKQVEERFRKIKEAYTVLKDAESRRLYDMTGINSASSPDFGTPDWASGTAAIWRKQNSILQARVIVAMIQLFLLSAAITFTLVWAKRFYYDGTLMEEGILFMFLCVVCTYFRKWPGGTLCFIGAYNSKKRAVEEEKRKGKVELEKALADQKTQWEELIANKDKKKATA